MREKIELAAHDFVNSTTTIHIQDKKLVVSSIFKLYAKDFDKWGGPAAYISSLLDPAERADAEEIKIFLQADFPDRVDFQYDWTINHIKNKKK